MYYACIYSVINYCISVWGGVLICTRRADSLISLQNRIVKNIFAEFYPGYTCIYKSARILKITDVYRFRVSIYMYKIVKLQECPELQRILNLEYPTHRYPARVTNFVLPFPRVEAIRYNFKYQFINIYNELPDRIRNIESLGRFRSELFEYFLGRYWSWDTFFHSLMHSCFWSCSSSMSFFNIL